MTNSAGEGSSGLLRQRIGWPALIGSLVLLALAASAPGLRNGFAFDDVLIIRDNPQVHSLSQLAFDFVQGYWPREHGGALYRPLTLAAFSVEWVVGNGAPWVFHAVNVALYAALTLAIFGLALEFLPISGAWIAAALFAVHPVHVEAVGNVVGQAELTTALLVCLGVWLYVRARRRPELTARDSVALVLLVATAALCKENGIILLGLLAAAEVTVVTDPRPLGPRVRSLLPAYLLLFLGALIVMIARRAALGATVGEYPALVLGDLGLRDRVLTMLGIVPEWVRLFVWPAHLRADYGPAEFVATNQFGPAQALGLALGLVTVATGLAARRRRPALAFGIAWVILSLLPVSNILVTSGILLAERTLLLASVGVALAAGAIAAAALRRMEPARPVRWAAAGGLGVLLVLGAVRSASRQAAWMDTPSVVQQLVRDAPLNYRGWLMYGAYLRTQGRTDEAREAMLRSAGLYHRDGRVYQDLGQLMRFESGCARAVPLFRRSLEIDPTLYQARGRLYVCLLELGDTTGAMALAADGAKRGEWFFQLVMARAGKAPAAGPDSALPAR
jgi:tetratricopeptide (TPR) repeat protein